MKMNFNVELGVNSNVGHMFIQKISDELFPTRRHVVLSAGCWDVSNKEMIEYVMGLDTNLSVTCPSTSEAVIWGNKDWFVFMSFRQPKYSQDKYNSVSNSTTVHFYAREYETAERMAKEWDDHFDDRLSDENANTNWASLRPNGEIGYTTMELKKFPQFYPEFYPYINGGNVEEYIEKFIESKSSILILIGDPGLGKSSLINEILLRSSWTSVVAYDEQVMGMDAFYIDFISGHRKVMVLEDADILLSGRAESGNKVMSKILNVSDGIIDAGKKFIFSANLKSTSDIDDAMTRPGRCFDIMNFRPLNRDEAKFAAEAAGKVLSFDKDQYTMAEIFNSRQNEDNVVAFKKKIGFRS